MAFIHPSGGGYSAVVKDSKVRSSSSSTYIQHLNNSNVQSLPPSGTESPSNTNPAYRVHYYGVVVVFNDDHILLSGVTSGSQDRQLAVPWNRCVCTRCSCGESGQTGGVTFVYPNSQGLHRGDLAAAPSFLTPRRRRVSLAWLARLSSLVAAVSE